jgi:hypothetical protein
MVKLFGWEFRREDEANTNLISFTAPDKDDGAVTVAATAFAGAFIDLEGSVRTEAELISRYRTMALQPEIISAVDEIANEAVNRDDDGDVVKVYLDKVEISPKLKKIIEEEFEIVKKLLKFNSRYYDIFRRWYIDGRLYYHAIIDRQKTEEGIQEVRYIDPRKIRKVREIARTRAPGSQDTLVQTKNEYYIYNDRGFAQGMKSVVPSASGLRIAKDSIVQVTSGIMDSNQTMVLSYLHRAIKFLNELRTMEDATVIYRVSRAPERRVWYIDIGQLPKQAAEQYMRDIMVKHKNRLNYDNVTGEIRDDRRFMTMLEDYWLPRREGARGTEVSTLPSGQNLGKMEDVLYFQKRLYGSLCIPMSRLDPESNFNLGRPMEITREELKFGKFIDRLRTRFAMLFTEMLEKQLVLKKIFSIEEWLVIKDLIEYEFIKDSYFTELKEQEILLSRMNVITSMEPYIGRFYSNEYIRKNVLKQDNSDMEELDEQIAEEQENFQYLPADQKMMLQQQEAQQQQMAQEQDQMAAQQATPEGQAQSTVDQMKQNPNRSLQDESKFKQAQKMLPKKSP